MTRNTRSRLGDLQVVAIIITIVLGLGGAAWTVVSTVNSLMPRTEAAKEHNGLHKRISDVNETAEHAKSDVHDVKQTIGRDVKTIKCLLTAPSRKAKENCGLED